jgi:2-haloacid dehalogenase
MSHGELDYERFQALTFDCYGTLIDWETGILRALRATLDRHGVDAPDDELLELYATAEEGAESGPYLRYRAVLARCLREVCGHYGVDASDEAAAAFGASVGDWPAFPDSSAALARLKTRFRLGVLTNCDDDLFAATNRRLGVDFDWIVTAQSVGSYKPDRRNFEAAFRTLGLPRDRILHVAQSLFHDHVPAQELGLSSVWIDRRHDRPGPGASPPATVTPNATFPDMASFAATATASPATDA